MESNAGFIERGRVRAAAADGYEVESLDRRGIASPPLLAADGETYAEGDMVLFVLFRDGTGKILCRA